MQRLETNTHTDTLWQQKAWACSCRGGTNMDAERYKVSWVTHNQPCSYIHCARVPLSLSGLGSHLIPYFFKLCQTHWMCVCVCPSRFTEQVYGVCFKEKTVAFHCLRRRFNFAPLTFPLFFPSRSSLCVFLSVVVVFSTWIPPLIRRHLIGRLPGASLRPTRNTSLVPFIG